MENLQTNKDHLIIALREYAERDIVGIQNNARVLAYFKEIGHKWVTNDDTAWCATFVNWVLLKAGKPQTGLLNARSFLTYGVETKTPEIGDIVVLWRIAKDSPYGHVGFFVKETKKGIYILGGNQDDSVNIKLFAKTQVLQYRKLPLV